MPNEIQSKSRAGRPPGRSNVATTQMRRTLGELAREHTGEALETVLEVMRSGETHAVRLAAANVILDRGYGKAQAAVAVAASRESEGLEPGPVAAAVMAALEVIHSDVD